MQLQKTKIKKSLLESVTFVSQSVGIIWVARENRRVSSARELSGRWEST